MRYLGFALVYAGFAVFLGGTLRYGMRITLADVVADVLTTAGFVLIPILPMAAFGVAVTVIIAWGWWHDDRRKRRGRLAAIGAKSKARIAAMTARMRERPARPVLRPVPQGGAR